MKNVFATLLFSLTLFFLLISVSNADVLTIRPNAAGINSGWIGTPLNTYEDVDEAAQNGDADYFCVSAKNAVHSFSMVDHTTETGTISNVRVIIWAKHTVPSEGVIIQIVSGSAYDGATIDPLTATYVEHTSDWATDPAGGDWTWTDIDNIEAGIKSIGAGAFSPEDRVTQVYVEVTYATNNAPNAPVTPECDGKASPAITTETAPDFTWVFSDQDGGDSQSAYAVLVSTSSTSLDSNTGEMWDTLKYVSIDSSAAYGGSALSEDTTYYWKVKTWDAGDSSGPYCGTQLFFLQAGSGPAVPTGLVATASTKHSISLSWQADENVRYAIEKSSNSTDFSMIEQWSDNITNNAYTAMNLKAGSSYWFKVYGYNQSEVMSGPSTPAVKMTKSVAVVISSSAYTKCGNVNDCEVLISSGTFQEDVYIEIDTNPSLGGNIGIANGKLNKFRYMEGSITDINIYNMYGSKMEINDFQNSIYLRIYYNITEVANAGIDEQSLRIYTLNDEREQWVKVGGVHNVNETGHFVEVPVEHFSVFSLVGGGESLELVNMANYPNPFSDETVFIFEITKRANIKLQIFTTSGRLLMTFEEPDMDPGYNTIPDTGGGWNGTDVNGSNIASGLYFWKLTATPEGGTPVSGTGKLTIIR